MLWLLIQKWSCNISLSRMDYCFWRRNTLEGPLFLVEKYYMTVHEKLKNKGLECKKSKYNKLILQIFLCQKSAVSLELLHAVLHEYY